MKYVLLGVFLLIILKIYIDLALKFNIVDRPNSRSSHHIITVRGGGIIFPIGAITWFVVSGFQYPLFFIGLFMISLISFWDDVSQLSKKTRLVFQTISIGLLISEIGIQAFPWWAWLIILILLTGIINTFNFMDGINGITTGYSLAVLAGIWLINNSQEEFITNDFIYFTAIAIVVFSFFNFRKNAICFAGDVGSVSIAFILVFMLTRLIIQSENLIFLLFLGIYGTDSVLTILHRIWNRENIFEAHRKHLYQLMANELKLPHLVIATSYALVQFAICILIYFNATHISNKSNDIIFGLITLGTLTLFFSGIRLLILQKITSYTKQNLS